MLEIAQIWQESGFQPRRSVLFAAWGGGHLRYSGAHAFRERPGILGSYELSAVVHLDRLGGTTGDALAVRRLDGRNDLFDLLVSSADKLGVAVYEGAWVRHSYQYVFREQSGGRHGTLVVTWGNPPSNPADDTLEHINSAHLIRAVEVVNLTLITAAHEPTY
jgi:hypothetical protein